MKTFALGLTGGLLGAALFHFTQGLVPPAHAATTERVLRAQGFQLVDGAGKVKAEFTSTGDKQGGLMFYDNAGRIRLSLGLYGDQTGVVAINDKNGNAVQILRVFGPAEAPLHIFKTNSTDMMITGLNPTDHPTPFLMYYDGARKRTLPFGVYQGP